MRERIKQNALADAVRESVLPGVTRYHIGYDTGSIAQIGEDCKP